MSNLKFVNFKDFKDNGKDLGFECNLKTNSPEGLRIEIIKNLVNE
jgi:hypothetical protein